MKATAKLSENEREHVFLTERYEQLNLASSNCAFYCESLDFATLASLVS